MTTHEGRLHALDNLRALMMWLGIVIHGAMSYTARETPVPWRDEHRTLAADMVLAFIHAFRMPVFFVLAGFFVTMLLQSRGPRGMARHRLLRLGLPFALFWPVILVASSIAALALIHLIMRGTWGIDETLLQQIPRNPDFEPIPTGPNTMHMWFLWMLLWMSLATALVAHIVPSHYWEAPARWLRGAAGAWWGPFVLAVPLVATDMGYPQGVMFPSGAFVPHLAEWVHHGLFFVVGLAMFTQREVLFATFQRRWVVYAVAGLVPWVVAGGAVERHNPLVFTYAYALAGWLWSFAWIGAALKWMPSRSAALGYLADSSYWVYLVHFPLTIAFAALMYGADWPGAVKAALNIGATTAVCLATYHLFVRFTWVSVLLNGKRHVRFREPAIIAAN